METSAGEWQVNTANVSSVVHPNFAGPAGALQTGLESTDSTDRATIINQAMTYYNASHVQVATGWFGAVAATTPTAGINPSATLNAAKTRLDARHGVAC